MPQGMSDKKKKILPLRAAPYTIVNRFLYKLGLDEVLSRCVLDHERESIMHEEHYGLGGRHDDQENPIVRIMVAYITLRLLKICQ